MIATVKLGDKVRDRFTGFAGIVCSRTEWLFGCTRILIEPETLSKETGKPVDGVWFDEQRVELLAPGYAEHVTSAPLVTAGQPGGPQDDPVRRDYPN